MWRFLTDSGTGLFLGTGGALANGGPLGLFMGTCFSIT